MGWDISMYAEVRRRGHWRLAEPLTGNPSFDPARPEEEPEQKPVEIYDERNSELFAILAGVGRLGGDDSPFPCISPPRGTPPDLSTELANWYAQNDGATFATSWLLLTELLDFDWAANKVLRRGMVEPNVATAFRSATGGEPDPAWPTGVPYLYADQILSGPAVEVRWWQTCAEAVGDHFLHDVFAKLKTYGPPHDVRVAFWFSF
jgi:hypothetical protein